MNEEDIELKKAGLTEEKNEGNPQNDNEGIVCSRLKEQPAWSEEENSSLQKGWLPEKMGVNMSPTFIAIWTGYFTAGRVSGKSQKTQMEL